MTDKFDDLRTLVTVLSAGGVSAAAAELGIAKSAVSRRVADLEDRLGVALFERVGRRLEPTAVGLDYARRARSILDALADLEALHKPFDAPKRITICAAPEVILHVLMPAIADLSQSLEADGIRLDLATHRVEKSDVTVMPSRQGDGSARPLLISHIVTCGSPDYLAKHGEPTRPDELDGHGMVAIGTAAIASWRIGDRRRPANRVAIVVPNVEAAACAAVDGAGLTQVPEFAVLPLLTDGRLRTVLRQDASPIHLFAVFDDDAPTHVLKLVDDLVEAIRRRV